MAAPARRGSTAGWGATPVCWAGARGPHPQARSSEGWGRKADRGPGAEPPPLTRSASRRRGRPWWCGVFVGGDARQRGTTSSGSAAGRRPPHMDGRGRRKGRGGGHESGGAGADGGRGRGTDLEVLGDRGPEEGDGHHRDCAPAVAAVTAHAHARPPLRNTRHRPSDGRVAHICP